MELERREDIGCSILNGDPTAGYTIASSFSFYYITLPKCFSSFGPALVVIAATNTSQIIILHILLAHIRCAIKRNVFRSLIGEK